MFKDKTRTGKKQMVKTPKDKKHTKQKQRCSFCHQWRLDVDFVKQGLCRKCYQR